MRINVYAVFDRASGVYDRPWCARSDDEAMRSFGDIARDPKHPIGKHPEDFTLFRIGTYSDDKGELKGEIGEKVINGIECVATPKPPLQEVN